MADQQLLELYRKKIRKYVRLIFFSKHDHIGPYRLSLRSIRRLYQYSVTQINSINSFFKLQPNAFSKIELKSDLQDHLERLTTLKEHFIMESQEFKPLVKKYDAMKRKLSFYRVKSITLKTKMMIPSIMEASYSFSDLLFFVFLFLGGVFFIYFFYQFLKKKNL